MRAAISTPAAPKAIGPYSQAVRTGQLLFVSGQIPADPASGKMIAGNAAEETRRVLLNIGEILKAAGASYADVVRTTVFLTDLTDYVTMNEVYGTFFAAPHPARSTVRVAGLPNGARVEIDVIAAL